MDETNKKGDMLYAEMKALKGPLGLDYKDEEVYRRFKSLSDEMEAKINAVKAKYGF